MCWAGKPGISGTPGSNIKYRFHCQSCGHLFNKVAQKSESLLVNVMKSGCPKCDSDRIEFTEYGRLLNDRMLKISALNKISDK